MFPDELRVSSFPNAWTTAQSAPSDFVGSRVYACVDVTCHLHFWQNDQGLLRAAAVTRGWNGHRITAHKVNSAEENVPVASAGIRTRNLSIMSPGLLPTSYPCYEGMA